MELTKEQQSIATYFRSGAKDDVRIMAFAGSGKTFILKQIASILFNKKGCYLAFNKALAAEAKSIFPPNVRCSTVHSLAFTALRPKLTESPKTFVNQLPFIIEDMPKKYSWPVYYTLQNYCKSTEDLPTEDHVFNETNIERYGEKLSSIFADVIFYAKEFWELYTKDPSSIPVCHEHYLKLYSFSNDIRLKNLDFILFDEAQDANPVMIKILEKLKDVRKIVVGDPYQQIYEFTGAVDSLSVFSKFKTFYLSNSFRWGNSIGELSTNILEPILDIDSPSVKGNPDKRTSIEFNAVHKKDTVDAILCRTNKTTVELGMELNDQNIPVLLPDANLLEIQLRKLNDFKEGNTKVYAGFFNWKNLIFSLTKDLSLIPNAWMVKEINDGNYTNILNFLNKCKRNRKGIYITTGHKSKGLEWDSVLVTSDFLPAPQDSELRLFYVVCTRARKNLYLAEAKQSILDKLKEGFKLSPSAQLYFGETG